ncbi:colicin E3/pyocin S6 family cytotoxin [Amycolatopsis pretoriensis]|uniref:colicin E3/pyocin S6 family cytotoxin n=1 Tax=Amycolatopsis pretoriensis TaxID=218821 RepID=UPI001ABF3282
MLRDCGCHGCSAAQASRGGGDNCRYTSAPKSIPGVPGLSPAKPKTSVQGGGGLRKRRKDSKGNIAGRGPVPERTVEP